jgi:branched-chain amino acid transport system permease protein
MLSLAQVLTSGLGLAGYYALVAVGFALIFATLRIFHIAHGTVFLVGGYAFFALHRLAGVNLFVAAAAAMGIAGLLGLAIDKIIYGPVLKRGGGMFSVFIASLGVALIFEAGFLVWTKGVISVARTGLLDIFILGDVVFRYLDFVILAIVALACAADGVHLPERAMAAEDVRALAHARGHRFRVVSRAAHDAAGMASDADVLVLSPWGTVPGKNPPLGAWGFQALRSLAPDRWVIALGGIQTPEDAASARASGRRIQKPLMTKNTATPNWPSQPNSLSGPGLMRVKP